ncbi:MAG: epoxyqueuosine reductase QueH [Lachnospiraceae bacterium]|nr:epoxyqueuosine reductase QueH [Lachnospiraceae bacterium]
MNEKPKILLHSCCGPCSTAVVIQLAQDYQVTVFFYNPNIGPREEYLLRLENQKKFLKEYDPDGTKGIGFIEGDYDDERFYEAVRGLAEEKEGGARCIECFRLRLSRTAELAAELGFDLFTTTLTVSPHKNAELINAIGEELAQACGVPWLNSNFKKKDGYLRSIRLSKEYGLYRQNYCGCIFSMNDIK